MASRLKDIALIVLACAFLWSLVGLMNLEQQVRQFPRVPGGEQVGRLRRDVGRLNTTLRRIAVVDSVNKVLASTEDGLVLPADSGFTPVIADAARRTAGTDSIKARVVLLVLRSNFHIDRDINIQQSIDAEFVADSLHGKPWCAAVHYGRWGEQHGKYDQFSNDGERMRILGPCAFYARYGAPGRGVLEWLKGNGQLFADAPANYVDGSEWRGRQDRKLFGMRPMYSGNSVIGDSCLSGRDSACSKGVLQERDYGWWGKIEALPESPLTFPRYYSSGDLFGEMDRAMVAQLEEEFGAARFQKFWQSNEPLEQAFHAAFGLSLDAWVRAWGRARYGAEPVGPRMSLVTLLLSLLTVGAMVGFALLIVQRRAVR